MRTVHFWVFCSVKGGVGKSTLAVTCGKLLDQAGRCVVVVDCDLTGTSLADGLGLCAPKMPCHADGRLDLEAAPSCDFHDPAETRRLRAYRRDCGWSGLPPPPVYLNDLLAHRGTPRADAALWQSAKPDGVGYLPSSSLPQDVRSGLQWLAGRPFDWIHRLTWVLDALLDQQPKLTDVVLDLPPGVWGFSHEVLVLMSTLSLGQSLPEGYPPWQKLGCRPEPHTFLLMTEDWGDMLPALEYAARQLSGPLPKLVPTVNRVTSSREEIRRRAKLLMGDALGHLGIDQRLVFVNELRDTLGRLFQDQQMVLDQQALAIGSILGLEGYKA